MKAKLTRGLEKSKYGMISKIELPNKSKIYILNKGWGLVSPPYNKKQLSQLIKKIRKNKCMELLLPYSEINLAINETIQQGYIIK